jgi:hypothetical protein
MLEASQHLTSNYVTEPYQQKQHGTGIKTDMKTDGIEDPEISPYSYSHLILDKGAKNITLEGKGGKTAFLRSGTWKTGYHLQVED